MGHAGFGIGVEHREIELVFGGVEIDEEVVDFVQDCGGAGVGAVDLIQDNDGRKLGLQGFLQDVTRLRERAFARVHQEEHTVDHSQGAFDFAAEVAVTGRIDDVDAGVSIKQRCVLGQDGDSALAFQIIGIHHPIDDFLVDTKDAALTEHGVDQGGFAVVDVSDDGDITDGFIHKS